MLGVAGRDGGADALQGCESKHCRHMQRLACSEAEVALLNPIPWLSGRKRAG